MNPKKVYIVTEWYVDNTFMSIETVYPSLEEARLFVKRENRREKRYNNGMRYYKITMVKGKE